MTKDFASQFASVFGITPPDDVKGSAEVATAQAVADSVSSATTPGKTAADTDPMRYNIAVRINTIQVKQRFSPTGSVVSTVACTNIAGGLEMESVMFGNVPEALMLASSVRHTGMIDTVYLSEDTMKKMRSIMEMAAGNA